MFFGGICGLGLCKNLKQKVTTYETRDNPLNINVVENQPSRKVSATTDFARVRYYFVSNFLCFLSSEYSFSDLIACPDIGRIAIILKIVMRPTPISPRSQTNV